MRACRATGLPDRGAVFGEAAAAAVAAAFYGGVVVAVAVAVGVRDVGAVEDGARASAGVGGDC